MPSSKSETLWALTQHQRLRYGAAIAAMGLGTLLGFGVPLVTMAVVDGVLGDEPSPSGSWAALAARLADERGVDRTLWIAGGVIVVLTALAGVCAYLRGRWAALASESIVRAVRDRLYGHLDNLPCSYHDRAETGDLVQRCTSDVETLRVFLSGQVVEIGRATLLLLTAIPILVTLDGTMTAVSLALFPVIIGFAVMFFRRIKSLFLEMDEAEAAMTTVLQENLTGIRVVRAFARQEHEVEKFAAANALFRDRNQRLIGMLGRYWATSDLLCLSQVGVSLMFGAFWFLRGEMSLGTLVAFQSYLALVIWPVRQMGRVLADTGKAIVALGRLTEILDEPEESLDGEPFPAPSPGARTAGSGTTPSNGAELVVEGLTHSYDNGDPVLHDIHFHVRPGETLALLGPPGSGKSTLVHLLLRLYDYDTGSIRLDGRELSSIARQDVRSRIAAVLQEPFLYSKTIAANVRLGRADASEDELVASTVAADVHGAVMGLSDGYDTLLGERGVTLSGGQRQRLAIARALVRDAPLLVLDDALSAVDAATESHILSALRRRRGHQTTILIAHRLSSIAHADRILVLDHGRIVQAGTHAQLATSDGPYGRLWAIQGALEHELEAVEETTEQAGEPPDRAAEGQDLPATREVAP